MRLAVSPIYPGVAVPPGGGTAGRKKVFSMPHRELSPEETRVIVYKGTELPFSGQYVGFFGEGTYHCKRCDSPLFRSEHKFRSTCGWPSFDDAIRGAVIRMPDTDGVRTEIVCATCGAHLGHVFTGESLTEKNTRHCVNSLSLIFCPEEREHAG